MATRTPDTYRSPPRWMRVVLVVLAVLLPLALWDERGAAVGVAAFIVYGGLFLVGAFNPKAIDQWGRRHAVLDAALIVPLTFFAVAYLTDVALAVCAAIALAVGAVFVPFAMWRRR